VKTVDPWKGRAIVFFFDDRFKVAVIIKAMDYMTLWFIIYIELYTILKATKVALESLLDAE